MQPTTQPDPKTVINPHTETYRDAYAKAKRNGYSNSYAHASEPDTNTESDMRANRVQQESGRMENNP